MFLLLPLTLSSLSAGDITSGNLWGRVHDAQGHALPNVSLKLVTPLAKSTLSTETSRNGEFEFLLLPPGRYWLGLESSSFGGERLGPFRVLPGETLQLRIRVVGGKGDQPSMTVSSSLEDGPEDSWYQTHQTTAFPGPLSLWRFLQNQQNSIINHPPDFGGLDNTRLPLLSQEAGSWTATEYRLNGLDVTDSYQPGRAVFFPAVETVDLIAARMGPKPASSSAVGAGIEVFSYPEERHWHGSLSSLFTSSEFFSDNLSAQARAGGIMCPEQYRWFTRNRAEFGMPLGRRGDLVVSGAGQWASQRLPREPASEPLDTRLLFGNARGRVLLRDHDQIRAGAAVSRIDRSSFGHPAAVESLVGRRMAPPFRPSNRLREEDHLDSIQLGWTHSSVPDSGPALEIRYGWGTSQLDTHNRPATQTVNLHQSRIELTDGSTRGPPPIMNQAVRNRHGLEAVWQSRILHAGGTHHQVTLGGSWQQSNIRNRMKAPQDSNLILAEGQPSSILQLNTTLDSRSKITNLSFHIDDRVRLRSWISVAAGIRGEWPAGSLPAQSSPNGTFRPARSFAETGSIIEWNNWSPRLSVTLSPPITPNIVIRASFSRFHYPLAGRYLDFGNPNSLSGREYRWNDRNQDSLWQPVETGTLLRRFGGEFAEIDGSLRRPYSDEFTVAISADLPFSLHGRLRGFRRDDKDRIAAVNVGVPFLAGAMEQAFRPRQVRDPGTDFVEGTFDDQTLIVYEQLPSTFGEDRFLLTNPGLRSFSSGLVAELSRQEEQFWWKLSFTAEKGFGATNPGNDPWENDPGVVGSLFQSPNTLINAAGRTFFDRAYVAKLQTVYEAPRHWGGFEVGAVINYFDGLPFGRKLLISDFAQGPLVVMATPRGSPGGGQRTEFNLTADLSVSREFRLPVGRLRSSVEVFNLPNIGNSTLENDISGRDFAQRLPIAIQPPRYFRVGLAYEY